MDYAALNKILLAQVQDLADRRPPRRVEDHSRRVEDQRVLLAKSLGLHPEPPRTDLNAQITGVIHREGYRIEKLRYESRPEVLVTAHLYLPDGEGRYPLILNPHGHFEYKKCSPVVQAKGIGLALLGFACLIVDSPGVSWDDNDQNERKGMGTHDDPWLAMGCPVQGQYVWDLVRGLDYCETRPELDCSRVGITGASGGGTATMLAFAYDERIKAAAPVCAATSLTVQAHNGCYCNHLPGILQIGDRADILAMRAPAPICLIGATEDPEFPPKGHQETFQKLQRLYRLRKLEDKVRLELVEGGHDYSRRMREAMYAFFAEHLRGEKRRSFIAEPRPLTDGQLNSFEAGTEPFNSPELAVTQAYERSTRTFRQLLEDSLSMASSDEFDPLKRLMPWTKFGPLDFGVNGTEITLGDAGLIDAKDGIVLNSIELDLRLLIYLGLGPAEFLAQVLHLGLPGKPDSWESAALGTRGDALSSMIASVKTLVKSSEPVAPIASVKAVGPLSSLVAHFLQQLRENLQIHSTDRFGSWMELYRTQNPALLAPGARYLGWPESAESTSE